MGPSVERSMPMSPACAVHSCSRMLPLRRCMSRMPPKALSFAIGRTPVSNWEVPSICALRMFTPPPLSVGRSLAVPALPVWPGFTISTPSKIHALALGELPRMIKWLAWSLASTTPGRAATSLPGSKKVAGQRRLCSTVKALKPKGDSCSRAMALTVTEPSSAVAGESSRRCWTCFPVRSHSSGTSSVSKPTAAARNA